MLRQKIIFFDPSTGKSVGRILTGYPGVNKIFKTTEEASLALKHIKKLRREQKDLFKIHNAAVLVKDAKGQSNIKETADVSTKHGRIFGAFVGGLFGLLGGPIGVVIGALAGAGTGAFAAKHIDMGFSNDFLDSFQENACPTFSKMTLTV